MGKKGKSGNAKKVFIAIAAVLLSSVVVGTAVRIKRENDDKEEEKTEYFGYEMGVYDPGGTFYESGELNGSFFMISTEYIPYDNLNVTRKVENGGYYRLVGFNENKEFTATGSMHTGNFVWENDKDNNNSSITTENSAYVRIMFPISDEDGDGKISKSEMIACADKVTITYGADNIEYKAEK